MNQVTIQVAESSSDLDAWITFPRERIYDRSSPWVAPQDEELRRILDHTRNPLFRHMDGAPLLARDARGRVVGRLHVHVDHAYIQHYDERAAFFGFFECVDDVEVARALFAAAEAYGHERGCTLLRGPFSLTSMQEFGLLIDGFDEPPSLEATYTAAYYPALLEAAGLRPTFFATTFCVDDLSKVDVDAMYADRHRELLAGERLRIRPFDQRRLREESGLLCDIANDAFAVNPFFVPFTREEWAFFTDPYLRYVDPSFVLIAELDGEPCGFEIVVPDVSPLLHRLRGRSGPRATLTYMFGRRRIRSAVGTFVGVRQQVQKLGLLRILEGEVIRALQRASYQRLFLTWMADNNPGALTIPRTLGARRVHRIALYEQALGAPGAEDAEHAERDAPVDDLATDDRATEQVDDAPGSGDDASAGAEH